MKLLNSITGSLNSYLLGFEVECVISVNFNSLIQIQNYLRKNVNNRIVVTDDTSINPELDGDIGAEIKTPPLRTKESLALLHKIFGFVGTNGYTNSSCGLHLNISPLSDSNYYKINPFYLHKIGLWNKMKKGFNRVNCFYCQNIPRTKLSNNPLIAWKQLSSGIFGKYDIYHYKSEHYNVINFEHCHEKRRKSSRIEIRGMGGEDYHKMFKKVFHYTIQSIKEIGKSYESRCTE